VPPNTTSAVVVIEERERVIGLLVDAVSSSPRPERSATLTLKST
jgi:chemotaxis signal transduction protein